MKDQQHSSKTNWQEVVQTEDDIDDEDTQLISAYLDDNHYSLNEYQNWGQA